MSAPVIDLPDRMNAATYFVDANAQAGRGDKIAIHDAGDGSTYTYNDVLSMTNRTGNALKGLGVRREDRVMLLLLDSPEFACCFFGAIKIGAVPIPTNTLLKSADYEFLLNDSRARVLLISEPLLPRIEPIRDRLTYLDQIVVVGQPPDAGAADYRELVEAASAELAPEMLSKDDACFWLYSSGTTAFPKGAVHLQHDMIVAFAYGLGNGLYFPFRVGASTVLYPGKPDAIRAYQTIQDYRPSLFFSVPTGYAGMLAVEDAAERFDTTSLRLCISAGESLPAALFERWQARFGVEILDGIGSTEILHIFISNRPGRVRPGSTGQIVPGYEAVIVDDQGREVPDGGVGDLLIKGDSTCACYWNRHEATKDTILGQRIRTGDKYSRDRDGYFWYQGRSDDMLKVGGIWVSPVEVESALIGHPAVLECAVVGVADDHGLVKPKAYVVLKEPSDADQDKLAAELQNFVKETIAVYKYPRWIEFVTDLPKTATGKIQRYKLRG
ncbi:MAG: benzoate-CoA ligase family protein [Planctomycetota bacterium]|jgi:benzoate-CoA ligase